MYARACVETEGSNAARTVQKRATPLALISIKTITHDGATMVLTLRNVNFFLTATVHVCKVTILI